MSSVREWQHKSTEINGPKMGHSKGDFKGGLRRKNGKKLMR